MGETIKNADEKETNEQLLKKLKIRDFGFETVKSETVEKANF